MKRIVFIMIICVLITGCANSEKKKADKARFEKMKQGILQEDIKMQELEKVQEAKRLKEEERLKKIQEIEKNVKKIAHTKYYENYYGYKKLLKLDPENDTYKDKMEYYLKKIRDSKKNK